MAQFAKPITTKGTKVHEGNSCERKPRAASRLWCLTLVSDAFSLRYFQTEPVPNGGFLVIAADR